ncbi:hypothetical protein [Pseudoxanthomonas sp. PXM01]|uniref:AbiTii domain-containing protein n=1 Tax=Pseudoxanthomonas sp. PXM01 TaxID=2769295 RepID=UPI00177BE904|nr:hypothetical protein [Pseudoxanthomonas sp. PXM01]
MGLIDEIVNAAMDKDTPLADLLRKVKVASRRLELPDIEQWVGYELNGYPNDVDLPAYREVVGRLQAKDWDGSWKPVFFQNPEISSLADRTAFRQSVRELEEGISDARDGFIMMSVPPGKRQAICEAIGSDTEIAIQLPRSALLRPLEATRNRVLDWALELEGRGVKGDGLTFTRKEVTQAAQSNVIITTNNIGTMSHSQIQQHSGGRQNQENEIDLDALKSLMQLILARAGELDKSSEKIAAADAKTILTQIESGSPKRSILRDSLSSLRTVLESATGSAIAADLLPKLYPLLTPLGIFLGVPLG